MKPYVATEGAEEMLRRNALILYPYIVNQTISHGRAAEILGIPKMDLIDLYGEMGFPYFDKIMDELDKDLATFNELNDTTIAAFQEGDAMLQTGKGKRYKDTDELFDDLEDKDKIAI
jgi:hypothetical protein